MKKSSLFISALLTTFILVIMAGVITAYRTFSVKDPQTRLVQPTAVVQTISTVTPQDAAQIAARYLGRDDLYSVESTDLNGMAVYLVTFSSGDLVYVSTDGQVISVVVAQLASQYVQPGSPAWAEHEEEGDDD